jgi:hypothetical protein
LKFFEGSEGSRHGCIHWDVAGLQGSEARQARGAATHKIIPDGIPEANVQKR